MRKCVAVLGLQWGDEGKGKIVDLITSDADMVVRFQGGHNAGHTLIIGETKLALHLIPSGIMRPQTKCVIANGVVVACDALLKEIAMLEAKGVDVKSRLFISDACSLILPSHVALDGAREVVRGKQAIGTTKRGIGPAYEDKVARRGLRMADLLDEKQFSTKLASLLDYHNFLLESYYKLPPLGNKKILNDYLRYAEQLSPMISNTAALIQGCYQQQKNIVFEGAQGSLLDIDHGTYPYVTSSNTTLGAISTGSGFPATRLNEVLGIIKAYVTRVGSGPFPTELTDDVGNHLAEKGHEFGTTTGRARQCGWLDAVLAKRAIELSGVTALCVTKLDVLDGLSELKICSEYETPAGNTMTAPGHAEQLSDCKPIYETLPGWEESTVGITEFHKLPANAQAYIKRMEALLGVPVTMVSTGPERNETIWI